MKNNNQRFTANTEICSKPSWLRLLLLGGIILLLSVAGFAAPPNGNQHGKLAPDLASFPVNPDGTVDVIIQFSDTMQAKHFAMLAAQGGRLKNKFEQINGAAYQIPVKVLAFLENHPDIAYVTPDRPNTPSFDQSDAAAISAITVDVARVQYGLDGSGVGVAVIDSGVFNHDDLQGASGSRIVYNENFVAGDASANDTYGHGTHVAGIIGGNGNDSQSGYLHEYRGVAPNANIINLRVLNGQGAGNDSQVIAAIQRAIQLKPTYNIRVINLSLGRPVFESYTLDPLCQAVEAAWKAGIVVVVAAGNNGRDNSHGTQGYGTIQAPGNDPNVITVGATKDQDTATRLDDTVASYSSKGPTLIDHIVKPDVVAPGNRIVSLLAPGSTLAVTYPTLDVGPVLCTLNCNPAYFRLSGTSMATPYVAGAAALMIQKDPTLTPDTVKARMLKTAWKGYPISSWGYDVFGIGYFSQYDVFTIGAGYLDVDAALSNTDVANGGTASPTAVRNALTGKVSLVNGTSITWGTSIVWDNSIIWSDTIVWGSNTVLSNSILWGDTIVWGDATTTGFSIIWSDSIVWGIDGMSALSTSEDGEN
ncbi:MAG TPA: S8 family peptidase [Candidatus Angelobacter sp.]